MKNKLWKGKMNKILFGSLAGVLLLAGCASPSDEFDPNRVRQERFLVTEIKLPGSFADIQQSLFQHRDACNIFFALRPDPQQVHFATLTYRLNADDDLRESIIADLTAYASGNVQMDIYSYYSRNNYLAQDLLRALSNPEQCPRQD